MTTSDMKLIKQNENNTSAEKVASNDDLLAEVLIRSPITSLLRFKPVSKHWYSLITSPTFKTLRGPKPDPPSGLFVPLRTKPYLECDFVPYDVENPVKPPFKKPSFVPDGAIVGIEHSSNGLMLFHSRTVSEKNKYKYTNNYHVYNPSTKEFTTLPRVENYEKHHRLGMTIVFDPKISPHYKVVYVCGYGADQRLGVTTYQLEIYSSETRTSSPNYVFSLDEEIDIYFGGGIYWNNAIHWLHHTGFVLYFKLDEDILDHIYCPYKLYGLNHEDFTDYMVESRDHLLLVEIMIARSPKFNIFELKKDYSWTVKYRVDLEEVSKAFPTRYACDRFVFYVLDLVLGEKEDDSFLVLEVGKQAVRFNLVSKTWHKLHDFRADPVSIRSVDVDGVYVRLPNVFQFRGSLCGV